MTVKHRKKVPFFGNTDLEEECISPKKGFFHSKKPVFSHLHRQKEMPPKQAIKAARIPHTSNAQRLAIVDWLEIPANFRLITGSAGMNTAVVAGKKLKKSDAYKVYYLPY